MYDYQQEVRMNDFPTGKPHVSYSEIKNWKECSYRHKLLYVDGLQEYNPSPYADFGTALHNAIELFLKTKKNEPTKLKKHTPPKLTNVKN